MLLNKQLKGKVIWITGASGGLGRELAIALGEHDVNLILSARQYEKLQETQKLANISNDHCLIMPLDLTDLGDESLQEVKQKITEKFGKLDLIIHNASLSQRSLAHETLDAVERKIMETNFFGPVKLTKNFIPLLLKSSDPKVVIISSLAGKFGVPLRSSYCAAKHALHGFFESMKLELKGKLKFSFFVLGGVKTESAMHALNADGTMHQQLDLWHDRNMPAEVCAAAIVQKLNSRKEEIVIGRVEKLGLWLKKVSPLLHEKMLTYFFQKDKENLDQKKA